MKIFNLGSEINLSECRKKVFVFITLFIIVLSIYSNTFHASWHFDDISNIVNNKALHLTKLSWQNIKNSFFAPPSQTKELYRPVACLSLALNYYFGKANVLGYHIINISIHFLAAIFLFLFIYHTLNLPLLKARYGMNSYFIALLSTILWAINPIQTQAVTYIVQRMASMAGMFYIISMYLYVKGRTATQNPAKIILFILCAISILLAFGSKENAIMIPATLFLYDLLLIQGISRERLKKQLTIFLVGAILAIIICVIYFAFSDATLSSFFSLYEERPFTPWERLITQPRIIIFYISLLLYPMSTRLCIEHDIAISNSLFDPITTILSIMLIVGIVIGAIFISKRRPFIGFSILFFFLNHIIESSILPLELIFDHRNYIPSLLFFVPISIGLINALRYFSYKQSMQTIIAISIVLIIVGEGHATFMRNFTWRNEKSLWIDCIDKYPNLFRGHHNLGKYYAELNQDEKAIAEYKKALGLKEIHIKGEKSISYYNLGLIYSKKKEYEKAKRYYVHALKLNPQFSDAHHNLAALLANNPNNQPYVYEELKKAITYNPKTSHAYSDIGFLLAKMGKFDAAIIEIHKALQIDPDNVPALERLAFAYRGKGEMGKAVSYFLKALKQKPPDIRAILLLAETYLIIGEDGRARDILSQATDSSSAKEFLSFVEQIVEEDNILQIRPDMDVILPLLSEVFKEKGALFKKNSEYCLDMIKKKGNKRGDGHE